jgi:hypothetical protein
LNAKAGRQQHDSMDMEDKYYVAGGVSAKGFFYGLAEWNNRKWEVGDMV